MVGVVPFCVFFFCKQKPAYEMRISDWSSDVCSSDLFAKGMLLRSGIVLYGFRVTFQDIAGVGVEGVLIAMVMVGSVFGLAVLLGTRVFKLDRETAMLIGAGSAICGAAAVMATEPVVRAQDRKSTRLNSSH